LPDGECLVRCAFHLATKQQHFSVVSGNPRSEMTETTNAIKLNFTLIFKISTKTRQA
jgi:hypothetical protein